MDENQDRIYHIPEANFYRFEQIIAELQKRARKLDQPEPGFSVISEYLKEFKENEDGKDHTYFVKFFEVQLFGVSPKLAGWEFMGVIITEGAGNLISPLPGKGNEIPAYYRTSGSKCDHCKEHRNRKQTMIIRNESGEFFQVGSSCLRDFLGHISVDAVARFSEFLSTLDEQISDLESDFYPHSGGKIYYDPIEFLAYVVAIAQESGFTTKKNSNEYHRATAEIASNEFFAPAQYKNIHPSDEQKEKAKIIWGWAKEFYSLEENRESEFGWNYFVITSKQSISAYEFGRVAYLVADYDRNQEKIIKEKTRREANAGFVGNIGDKIEFTGIVLVSKIISENYRYSTYLLKFQDEAGHLFTWFASDDNGLEVGDLAQVKGKIKDHNEFRGEQSTIVTRCKVNKIEEVKE